VAPERELARLYGRIGGLRLAATRDPQTYTAKAREAFLTSDHVFCAVCQAPPLPDGLPELERARRLRARRQEHMARLAARSAAARRSA
jgi:hypothetical protein